MDDFASAAVECSFFKLSVNGKDNRLEILDKNVWLMENNTSSIENLEKLFIKFAGKLTNELPVLTSLIQNITSLLSYAIEKYHCFFTAAFVPLLVRTAKPMGSVRHPCHKMDD